MNRANPDLRKVEDDWWSHKCFFLTESIWLQNSSTRFVRAPDQIRTMAKWISYRHWNEVDNNSYQKSNIHKHIADHDFLEKSRSWRLWQTRANVWQRRDENFSNLQRLLTLATRVKSVLRMDPFDRIYLDCPWLLCHTEDIRKPARDSAFSAAAPGMVNASALYRRTLGVTEQSRLVCCSITWFDLLRAINQCANEEDYVSISQSDWIKTSTLQQSWL